ncbi:HD domain-containing protein [Erysipelothrix urinaevulpis]|uniref:HD domain-containing protein n=1 Tax=Erysipelothrix urinaevulpis TaxID=2683717 RepID=UPI0013575B69|nr:HD domain-containing protein [Erysipelothrix urinaevulpis]
MLDKKYKLCPELKVMRDPVHGYINVKYKVVWDLINSPEVQRLRRIQQLGGTRLVYHTAEHSRFSHSLGVYEIVRLMIERVSDLQSVLEEQEQVALLCAGLLHDVGHGPFSHSFEAVTKTDHEEFTERIILEDTQVNRILNEADPDLPQLVADIIAHRSERKILSQIISSQMDADRMDYLLRDSYFTGVSYGEFDLYRILRTIRVIDDKIVIKESGIHAVEDYIMARYQMYWQVYLHPVSRSFESILHALFRRMQDLYSEGRFNETGLEVFEPFIKGDTDIPLSAHFKLDESACFAGFVKLMDSEDEILKDLSSRLLNRDLFEYIDFPGNDRKVEIEKIAVEKGYDPRYYILEDFATQILYSPYKEEEESAIWVNSDCGLRELSNASTIVKGFAQGKDKEDHKLFFPKELQ